MKKSSIFFTALLITASGCSSLSQQKVEDLTAEELKVEEAATTVDSTKEQVTKQRHKTQVQEIMVPPVAAPQKRLVKHAKEKAMSDMALGMAQMSLPSEPCGHIPPQINREQYGELKFNGVKQVTQTPVATFSVDVDTGAYANIRRMLNHGQMPPKDAIRIEEMINYFSYNYPVPKSTDTPFSVYQEIGPSPYNADRYLLHIGLQGYQAPQEELPSSNLVFLIDVSGSMQSQDKLPLLINAFKLMVNQLDKKDKVSVVVYAGAAGVVLEPTAGDQKQKIIAALEKLSAGGSTHGSAGIKLAYRLAKEHKIENGINRVILATDGDLNVGVTDHQALIDMIEKNRQSGIALTTLGFGTGNYNEHLMEQLADKGNGQYAYIDTLQEAQKSLVTELSSTLLTIAKDVKIQVEFNPKWVYEYRLIGYENRALKREDFNNDAVDAGDIGAGHSVTAIFEITLNDSHNKSVEPLRYQKEGKPNLKNLNDELAFVRLRYKKPDSNKSQLIESAVYANQITQNIENNSDLFKFSAAVAGFGESLRGQTQWPLDSAIKLAQESRGQDNWGYRFSFIQMAQLAKAINPKL